MKVYLAGPSVFYPNWEDVSEDLKSLCYKHGMKPLYPLDNEVGGNTPLEVARAIAKSNFSMLQEADAVIADITEFRGTAMDTGTAFEIGVAIQRGIPVVTYTLDERDDYKDRVVKSDKTTINEDGNLVDSNNMVIENFGLQENLMISVLTEYTSKGAEEAIKTLLDMKEST